MLEHIRNAISAVGGVENLDVQQFLQTWNQQTRDIDEGKVGPARAALNEKIVTRATELRPEMVSECHSFVKVG